MMVHSPPAQTYSAENTNRAGAVKIYFPKSTIFCASISGYYAKDLLPPYIEGMTAAFDSGNNMYAFHDWDAMESYDTECRKKMIKWSLDRRATPHEHHVLLNSKFVAMGVSIAAMVLGGRFVNVYTERNKFEECLKAALARL